MHPVGVATRFAAVLAEGSFTDPENARKIYLAAGALVVVALCLLVGTIVWWRRGATEHPALGPLEVMGTRQWRGADYSVRQRELDEARPPHDGDDEHDPVVEPVDLEALERSGPPQFDDLADPLLAPAVVALPAEGAMDVPAAAPAPVEEVDAGTEHDETAATEAPPVVDADDVAAPAAEPAAVVEPEVPEPVVSEPSAAPALDAEPADGVQVVEVEDLPRAPIDPLLRTNAGD